MDPRRIRFTVTVRNAPTAEQWRAKARRIEALGYVTLSMPDHLTAQFAPIPALMAAADATTTLRVSAMVFANDYRNPVMLAKEIATLDLLSGGRVDAALGTGWTVKDYEMLGFPMGAPNVRVERLEEAVQLMKRLWTEEKVDHAGRHYGTKAATVLPRPIQQPHPPIVIGASRPAMLRLAGRHADVVSLVPPLFGEGAGDPRHRSADAVARQIESVRQSAGVRFERMSINMSVDIGITDDPAAAHAAEAAKLGVRAKQIAESPYYLYGPLDLLYEKMVERRDRFALSYYKIAEDEMETLAPLVRLVNERQSAGALSRGRV